VRLGLVPNLAGKVLQGAKREERALGSIIQTVVNHPEFSWRVGVCESPFLCLSVEGSSGGTLGDVILGPRVDRSEEGSLATVLCVALFFRQPIRAWENPGYMMGRDKKLGSPPYFYILMVYNLFGIIGLSSPTSPTSSRNTISASPMVLRS
jgi:hypothetical protein